MKIIRSAALQGAGEVAAENLKHQHAALKIAAHKCGGQPMSETEPYVERLRRLIESQYALRPTGCGGSFGELLCWEIHTNGMTFAWLAEKWGVSLSILGELIWDHCKRLGNDPSVDHTYRSDAPRERG